MGFVADVDWVELGAVAFLADCGGGFFAAVLLDVGEDYGGAFGGAEPGAAEADALGGAGDDYDFVLEAVGHGEEQLTVDSLQSTAKAKARNGKNLTQRTQSAQRSTEKN